MKFLLDTNLLSELLKRRPNPGVLRWVEENPDTETAISVLTVGEIARGAARLRPGENRARLEEWLHGWILPRFAGRILPLTLDATLLWGRRYGQFEREGSPKSVIDSLLAVTALTNGLAMVSRNERDFDSWDVPVINPWDDENGA